jgi:hypothetical protein
MIDRAKVPTTVRDTAGAWHKQNIEAVRGAMISLQLANPRSIIGVGPHCADIEIGCGRSLADRAERFRDVRFI